jgi:hypothetical protein
MQTHVKNFVKSVIFNATMWGFVFGSFLRLLCERHGARNFYSHGGINTS